MNSNSNITHYRNIRDGFVLREDESEDESDEDQDDEDEEEPEDSDSEDKESLPFR